MMKLLGLLTSIVLVLGACSTADDAGSDPSATTTDATTDATIQTSPSSDDATTTEPTETTTAVDTTASAKRFVDVYFVQGNGYAIPVATAVSSSPEVATSAMSALIAGPTVAQKSEGLYSSVPVDTELLGLTIDDGIARVDLSREFEAGGGSFSMSSRLAQVVYTLTEISTIDAVEFWLEGAPVTAFSNEGLVLDGPVDRIDVMAALPLVPTIGGAIDRWDQDDLPDISRFAETRRVVLVPVDDVLNVRLAAGADNEIIGMLAPGVDVALTGPRADKASSTWTEIVTPIGAGWVNGRFLAEIVDDQTFRTDERVISLLDRMSQVLDAEGPLNEFVSVRGLYVSHHAPPVRFTPDQLEGILTDPTTYRWPSNAINMDDPEAVEQEIPARTFAEAIGQSFASAWNDPRPHDGVRPTPHRRQWAPPHPCDPAGAVGLPLRQRLRPRRQPRLRWPRLDKLAHVHRLRGRRAGGRRHDHRPMVTMTPTFRTWRTSSAFGALGCRAPRLGRSGLQREFGGSLHDLHRELGGEGLHVREAGERVDVEGFERF